MASNSLNNRLYNLGSEDQEKAAALTREIQGMTAEQLHEHAIELFAVSHRYYGSPEARQATLLEAVCLGLFANFKQGSEAQQAALGAHEGDGSFIDDLPQL